MPAQAPVQGGSVQMPADSIAIVSLERRCFGCDRNFALTLRRDGTATRTEFGDARRGVADRQSTGVVAAGAFSDLARLVVAEGFFALADEYRDPSIADGEWAVTTVERGGRPKAVLDKHEKAPPALRRIQTRIEEVGKTVIWKSNER